MFWGCISINKYNKERVFDTVCDYSRFKSDYSSFWKNYMNTNMEELSKDRIPYLKEQGLELKKYVDSKIYNFSNKRRYTIDTYNLDVYRQYLNRVLMASHVYGALNKAEALAILVFGIDPDFDAYVIYKTSNTKEQVDNKLKEQFGFADENLIRIEQQIYNKIAVKEKHIIKLRIIEGEYN